MGVPERRAAHCGRAAVGGAAVPRRRDGARGASRDPPIGERHCTGFFFFAGLAKPERAAGVPGPLLQAVAGHAGGGVEPPAQLFERAPRREAPSRTPGALSTRNLKFKNVYI